MAKHIALTTQSQHPWRATIRTILAVVIALAAMAPAIYTAATMQSPELATGAVGAALAIAAAITRIMALPIVETFLQRFLPWLAAGSRGEEPLVPGTDVNNLPATKIIYRRDHGKSNFQNEAGSEGPR